MKTLVKIILFALLLLGTWAWTSWKDKQIPTLSWEQLSQFSDVPNNSQVKFPEGAAIHPLSFATKNKEDIVDTYRYVYVPNTDEARWKSAVDELQAGKSESLQKLLAETKQVVLVDTMRYSGQTLESTPQTILRENDVVGFCHRGSEYLKGNKEEFSQMFGHIPETEWVVLVENPSLRPAE